MKQALSRMKIKLLSYFYKRKNRSTQFGRYTVLFCRANITNSIVGDYTYFAGTASVNNCEIGKFCSIAEGVKIGLGKHPVDFLSTHPVFYSENTCFPYRLKNYRANEKVIESITESERVIIGNDVWIGVNAIVMDGVTIGDGAVIGAGAVVTKDVQPYTIVGGVPARVIRTRQNINCSWWEFDVDTLVDFSSNFKKRL
ncbi:CatB-related O-acetyltransferase [Escherichia coli]|uniref:CatB-related O-acetyltransferase n=1 Tax=Escherichia coli TaxID=562 RepID=UPI0007A5A678|nr:CatB-related O-acetyltransferase [Escherichia coli]EEV5714871.1 CatB-related O-acetyltransferase [Escherichia coli]EEW2575405.1 antibiotic acetyltransferase [Escherichia coli]EFC1565433.1 CatB-related O-acetyltransferase [Escherichia coli]EFC4576932.1 CatB-related O-acetyltransferase [Escherichia coli]EFF3627766.1 CatB-related O-acetyltransferase [Escherichia coli]